MEITKGTQCNSILQACPEARIHESGTWVACEGPGPLVED